MSINRKFGLPDLFVLVGAQTEETGTRVVAEIIKIICEGHAGTRKGAGFTVTSVPISHMLSTLRETLEEPDQGLDELDAFLIVHFRGSEQRADWIADNILQGLASSKIDVHSRPFRVGCTALPMTNEQARELASTY